MRTLTALCLGLLLTACAPVMTFFNGTEHPPAEPGADQQYFDEGLDRLVQDQDTELFLRLQDRFPESPWSARAAEILMLAERISEQERQLIGLRQQLERPAAVSPTAPLREQIIRCTNETTRLQNELDISNKQLEALRQLTIDLELKQP